MEPLRNPHTPGEYNPAAWEGAAEARRLLQEKRVASAAAADPSVSPEVRDYAVAEKTRLSEAIRGAEPVPVINGADIQQAEPDITGRDWLTERIVKLGQRPIAEQMRERLVGSQAPEPVMEVVSPDKAEGAKVTRVWAVDDEEFNKRAGEEMTDAEYDAVCHRIKPVQWDEEGNPVAYAPSHDRIDPEDGLARRVPTRAEREQAKQYAVRGFTPAVDDAPASDTVILPDPYVEPENPDLP